MIEKHERRGRRAVPRRPGDRRRRRAAVRAALGRATRRDIKRRAMRVRDAAEQTRDRRDATGRRHLRGRARSASRSRSSRRATADRSQEAPGQSRAVDAGRAAADEARARARAAHRARRRRRTTPARRAGAGRDDGAYARRCRRRRRASSRSVHVLRQLLAGRFATTRSACGTTAGEDNVLFLAGGIAFNLMLAAVPFILLLIVRRHVSAANLRPRAATANSTRRSSLRVLDRLLPAHAARHDSSIDKLILDILKTRGPVGIYSAIGFVWFSTRLFGSLRTRARERVRHRERARHHRRQDLRHQDHDRRDAAVHRQPAREHVRAARDEERRGGARLGRAAQGRDGRRRILDRPRGSRSRSSC